MASIRTAIAPSRSRELVAPQCALQKSAIVFVNIGPRRRGQAGCCLVYVIPVNRTTVKLFRIRTSKDIDHALVDRLWLLKNLCGLGIGSSVKVATEEFHQPNGTSAADVALTPYMDFGRYGTRASAVVVMRNEAVHSGVRHLRRQCRSPPCTVMIQLGNEQPVQRPDKHGALNRKLESAVLQQLFKHTGNAEPFPGPAEQQWSADVA